ncbi:hypothetical protein YB2330_003067 [Saitoella coloradoensis]
MSVPQIQREYRLPAGAAKGSFDALTLQKDVAVPKAEKGQVLVKIHAVSLNYRDLMIVKGSYPLPLKENPVPCSDGAGEVVAVGEGVSDYKVGDRVCGIFNQEHLDGTITMKGIGSGLGGGLDGCLTEYRAFPEYGLVKFPEHLSYEQAATLPCAMVTAWNALYGAAPLLPGQTVVVQGTGGVSICALQLAKAAGARVIATSSSDDKLKIAKDLGAQDLINYKNTPEWHEEVLKLTNGEGARHIVEVGGAGTLTKSFQCVALGGHIHAIGFVAGAGSPNDPPVSMLALTRHANLHGILIGSKRMFEDMNKHIAQSNIVPIVDKVFKFEEAKEAFEYLESQKHVGKVVVKVSA